MQKLNNEIEIIQGSDSPIEVQLLIEGDCHTSVFSLVNKVEIKAIFKKSDSTNLEKLQTTNGIEIVSAVDGIIKIKFESSETAELRSGKCLSFEIEVQTSTDGGVTIDTFIWQLEGVLNVKERLL